VDIMLLGHWIEMRSISGASRALEELARLMPGYSSAVGHACALETSMVLHLWPEAVHTERIPGPGGRDHWPDAFLYPKDRVSHPELISEIDPSGVVGDPGLATAELGRALFEASVKRVGAVVDRIASRTRSQNRAETNVPN
jgi:creatinine amidohydrolase